MASETFCYDAIAVAKSKTKRSIADHLPEIGRRFHRLGLPPKVESFNLIFFIDYNMIITN